MSSQRLEVGTAFPQFALPDSAGNTVSLDDLMGTKTIVYFYPAAGTPGCTNQTIDFVNNKQLFADNGYQIVGVSPDKVEKLAKFAEKHEVNFPLLSDVDKTFLQATGAFGEKKNYGKVYEGVIRSTLIIDAEGNIELAQYNVRAKGHVAKLLRDLKIDQG